MTQPRTRVPRLRSSLLTGLLALNLAACSRPGTPQADVAARGPNAPIQAQTMTAICRPQVSGATVVQYGGAGLGTFPDNNFDIIPNGNNTFKFLGTGFQSFYGGAYNSYLTGTLDDPDANGATMGSVTQNVKAGSGGGYDNRANNRRYVGVVQVYRAASNNWIGLYHSEQDQAGGNNFYNRLGLARSTDGGNTWYDLGEIVSPHVPYSPTSTAWPLIANTIFQIVNDGGTDYMVVYFSEQQGTEYDPNWSTSYWMTAARAKLSDVLAAAAGGNVPAFSKYYNGSWSQPGLGGDASLVLNGNAHIGTLASVYNTALGRYIAVGSRNSDPAGGGAYLIESTDGVNWGGTQGLFTENNVGYFRTVGLDGDDARAGSTFFIYYVQFVNGNPTNIARRTVTCDTSGDTVVDDGLTGTGQNQWQYQGTWGTSTGNQDGRYAGTSHYSNTANAAALLRFTGTQVRLSVNCGTGGGNLALSIGDANAANFGAETSASNYCASHQGDEFVYDSGALPAGGHTLRVRVTGTKPTASVGTYADLDRAVVSTTASTTVDDNTVGTGQNQWEYQGGWSLSGGTATGVTPGPATTVTWRTRRPCCVSRGLRSSCA